MVELYFDRYSRVEDLEKRMPHSQNLNGEKVLAVSQIAWFGLWPTIIRIARDYQNGSIDREECMRLMLEQGLKRHDSWPNADFFDQVGAYTLGYGYGKELILNYCKQQAKEKNRSVIEEYIEFMKRPVLPSQMQKALSGNHGSES